MEVFSLKKKEGVFQHKLTKEIPGILQKWTKEQVRK